ncbi:Holliday junction resolvase, partial [Candidatus Woesearchaeota archaeon]|nr:Holliday junction resolvase [Candidatus Woesearchaeota archaeon]
MNLKAKGISAERELIHLLWARGWFAVRVAGSGSTKYPSPDVIAGNGLRRLAIECKSSSDSKRYLEKVQIGELRQFAQMLNAEPWVAFRYNADWYFISL